MLGSLAAIWVSMMLIVVLVLLITVSAVVNSISSKPTVKVKDHSVLVINLDAVVEERPTTPDFMDFLNREPQPASLTDILYAIEAAADDDRIEGISIECSGSSAGFATLQSIRGALDGFKKSGKWITSYADAYEQGEYYIASVADTLCLNPVGAVDLHGLATGIPFFKGFLDKVGVEMQVVKVGTFKSAVEPFVLTGMSEANRLQTSVYLDALWGDMLSAVSKSRNIPVATLNQYADSLMAMTPADSLPGMKIVDRLMYRNEYVDLLKDLTSCDRDKDLRSINVGEYIAAGAEAPHWTDNKNKIAVYYACGDITENGREGIASERVVPDILKLAEDDDIEALVLRVNSGGGSAFASEQIWHALEVFKGKGKTYYVSMGDYAASGGYYISCGAKKIYAQPMTLTGSIGIFGLIPCVKELAGDKLGINVDFVSTNGEPINIFAPLTPFQRTRLQGEINRGYELFTKRCADGRHMSQDSIKAIAEGRVWDGRSALKIGLVDELGSLADATADLAREMGYKDYQIVNYPSASDSFWEMLSELELDMRVKAVKNELGDFYPVYREIRKFESMSPVQARMETIVIE